MSHICSLKITSQKKKKIPSLLVLQTHLPAPSPTPKNKENKEKLFHVADDLCPASHQGSGVLRDQYLLEQGRGRAGGMAGPETGGG